MLAHSLQDVDEVGVDVDAVQAAGDDDGLGDANLFGAEFGPAQFQLLRPMGTTLSARLRWLVSSSTPGSVRNTSSPARRSRVAVTAPAINAASQSTAHRKELPWNTDPKSNRSTSDGFATACSVSANTRLCSRH